MRAVKSRNTTPEMIVRRLLHSMRYRFRLHRKELPGKPDIVFRAKRKVIFIHGCFWHGHECRRGSRVPKTNTAYWKQKILRNQARDECNVQKLRALDWRSLVLWECQIGKTGEKVVPSVTSFLRE